MSPSALLPVIDYQQNEGNHNDKRPADRRKNQHYHSFTSITIPAPSSTVTIAIVASTNRPVNGFA